MVTSPTKTGKREGQKVIKEMYTNSDESQAGNATNNLLVTQ
jgi:hypothetical protein